MADGCIYCSVDTGGNHEMKCPLRWQPLAGSNSNWPAAAPKMDYQIHPLLGSGYDQGFKAGQKQGGAEVLAACQSTVEVFIQEIGKFSDEFGKKRPFKTWDRDDWEAAGLRLLTDVQDALEKVQPAAKDLEALRLRSYHDGATGAAVWFIKLLHGHPEDPPQMGCKPEAIRDKLEKLLLKAFNEGAFAATSRRVEKLEELLREVELKGLRFAEDALHVAKNPFSWANKLCGRIGELEKARAEGKG